MGTPKKINGAGNTIDNYDFALIGAGGKFPFRGYVSAVDPTTAEPGILIQGAQNVFKNLRGNIEVRPGLKRRGAADPTLAGTKSSDEWDTSLGYTRPMRVNNGKLQTEFDPGTGPQWYTLMSGLALSRFVFDAWWDDSLKKDCLLFVKGDTVIHRWGGGVGVVAAVSNAAGFISGISQPYAVAHKDSGGLDYVVGDVLTVAGGSATVIVDAVSPGGARAIGIHTPGSGYSVNDILGLAAQNNGKSAYIKVLTVDSGGGVATFSILSAGNGYNGNNTVNLAATGGGGSAFTAYVSAIGNTITAWHVQQNGSGYSAADNIALSGGTGTGATLSITAVGNYMVTLAGSKSVAQLGFEGTNQIMINGNTYSFAATTGAGGQSFVGLSSDPSAEAVGSVVLQVVVTSNNLPDPANLNFTNDFIYVINNQLHVGSYQSRLVYVSADDDFTNYTVPGSRVQGDPDLLTLDSNVRGITVQRGTSGQSGNAVISGGLGDWYTVVRSQITVGSTLAEQVVVTKSESADLATALAHEFITQVGDNIIFLDQNNQLREFGTARNIANPVFPLLSLDVFKELQALNFTGGHLRAVADEGGESIYLTCPLSGVDYFYQIRQKLDIAGNVTAERLWHPPQVRAISRIAVIDGVTYGHSSANPQIYQLWDTEQWHDDSPGTELLPYEAHAFFSYLNSGRGVLLIFDKLFVEGFMTPNTALYCNAFLEYQGAKNMAGIVINNPGKSSKQAKFYTGVSDESLGQNSLGDNPLGDGLLLLGGDDATVPKFRCIRGITGTDVFEYALDVYSNTPDCRWELECVGVNQTPSPRLPVAIKK